MAFTQIGLSLVILMQFVGPTSSTAQIFSEIIPAGSISSAEFNILYGDPLVVAGELTLSDSEVEKISSTRRLEIGLIPASLKISKIIYASPQVIAHFGILEFDEGSAKFLELKVFAKVYRNPYTNFWVPDWNKLTLSKFVVISWSPLLGRYYIDSMHQSKDDEILKCLESRVKMLRKWNSGSEERIARNKPNKRP